jgi:hypothetical protein
MNNIEELYLNLGKAVYQYNNLLEQTAAMEQMISNLRIQIKNIENEPHSNLHNS